MKSIGQDDEFVVEFAKVKKKEMMRKYDSNNKKFAIFAFACVTCVVVFSFYQNDLCYVSLC